MMANLLPYVVMVRNDMHVFVDTERSNGSHDFDASALTKGPENLQHVSGDAVSCAGEYKTSCTVAAEAMVSVHRMLCCKLTSHV